MRARIKVLKTQMTWEKTIHWLMVIVLTVTIEIALENFLFKDLAGIGRDVIVEEVIVEKEVIKEVIVEGKPRTLVTSVMS